MYHQAFQRSCGANARVNRRGATVGSRSFAISLLAVQYSVRSAARLTRLSGLFTLPKTGGQRDIKWPCGL
jgi:hypothetical protein